MTLLDSAWSESIGCPVIYTWRQLLQEEALTVAVKNDTLDLTEVCDEAVRDRKAVIEASRNPASDNQVGPEAAMESRLSDEQDPGDGNVVDGAKSSDPCDNGSIAENREYMIAISEAKRLQNRQRHSKKDKQKDGAPDLDLAEYERMVAVAREVCEKIQEEGVSREYLDGVVQKWNPNQKTGFLRERISGKSYFFRRRHVIISDSTSAEVSKGAGVSFTVGGQAPVAGRKPEAEYVFLLEDDWSDSTAMAVIKEVSVEVESIEDVQEPDEEERVEKEESFQRNRLAEDVEEGIIKYLKNYDVEQKQRDFDKDSFSCGVCFEDKQGRHCTQFEECSHVFCKDCMAEYFRVQIREGQVNALNCPTSDCDTQASHHQVSLNGC